MEDLSSTPPLYHPFHPLDQTPGPACFADDDDSEDARSDDYTDDFVQPASGKTARRRLCCGLAATGVVFAALAYITVRLAVFVSGPVCPRPSLPRPTRSLVHSSDLGPLTSITSTSSNFTLSYAPSLSTCNSFRVVIARTDATTCRTARENIVPSNDSAIYNYVTQKLGPDSFIVTVNGPERVVLERPSSFDEQACTYSFDVRLVAAGPVSLSVIWVEQDYDGFQEENPHMIRRHIEALTATPAVIDFCPETCTIATETSRALLAANSAPPRLAPCTGRAPITGSFLRSDSPLLPISLKPPYPVDNAPKFEFVPTGCEFRHSGRRFQPHSTCTNAPHRTLMIGDSHVRNLHEEVINRLQGIHGMMNSSIGKMDSGTVAIGQVDVAFLWNPFLDAAITCDLVAEYDSITISWGAHPAAWLCTNTTAFLTTLSEHLDTIQGVLRGCERAPGRPKPRFIYMTSPAWRELPGLRMDCRTGQRLEYWSEVSTALALQKGWSVIDYFDYSQRFRPESVDGTHYVGASPMVPVVDEWIDKVGICEGGPLLG